MKTCDTQCVLITGGSGFVGMHTAQRFLQAGYRVVLYDLVPPNARIVVADGTRCVYELGNVLDEARLREVVASHRPGGVIHCAAIVGDHRAAANARRATEVNVMGTLFVLEVAREYNLRVTYLSTATLYGQREDQSPIHESEAPDPVGIYDGTKLMAETLALCYHKEFGLDVTVIRPSFVYGPGSSVGRYYIEDAVRGREVREAAGADHRCDFTYVKDLADGIFRAHTVRPISHRVFNVSGGQTFTRRQFADIIEEVVPGARIDLGPGVPERAHRRGPCDISRARSELGYVPRYSLRDGIREWYEWLIAAESPESAAEAGGRKSGC